MDEEAIKALMNWIERNGWLDAQNKDLLEDAAYCAEIGNNFKAERDVKTAADNFDRDGKKEAAKACRMLLNGD